MSLFRDIGRKAERFKQTATEKAREVAEPDYRCRDCEAAIDGEVEACPECGSTDLVTPEDNEGTADAPQTGDREDAADDPPSDDPNGTDDPDED